METTPSIARDTANNMKSSANRRCAEEHWWKQLCSKALARGTNKGVFVITTGKAEALKFTNLGTAPCSLPVSVEDMGPNGLGDAQVDDDDIVLLFNGHNHSNGAGVGIDHRGPVVMDEGGCVWKGGQRGCVVVVVLAVGLT